MRLVWLTDIHLNFCTPYATQTFLRRVAESKPDAVLVSGDIAEATDVASYLRQMAGAIDRPIYFVLGNHDFYFGSIHDVRRQMGEVCREHPAQLRYLTASGVVELTPSLGLVGHDGWADGRIGDYEGSFVMLNDYKLIAELAPYDKRQRRGVLQSLGDDAGAYVREALAESAARYPSTLLVTHVPPMREAAWHEGRWSDDEWAPHFTCKAVGDAILDVMARFPDRQLTVLCGHTHGAGEYRPLPNVTILTGPAEYRRPEICRIFDDF